MKLQIPKNAKKVKKIKIKRADLEVARQKGLFDEGCYESQCNDICCQYGCDVDLDSLKLIYKYRDKIEPLIKTKLEKCFSTELTVDDDYVGGAYRETAVRDDEERCYFHLRGKKGGCALFYLHYQKGLPRKIIPSICRTYPITWHRGNLFVDRPIRRNCKCLEALPKGAKRVPSLYETQKRDLKLVFDMPQSIYKKLDAEVERQKRLAEAKNKASKTKKSAKKKSPTSKKAAFGNKKGSRCKTRAKRARP